MAEHQPLVAFGSRAVDARDDLAVGAAHSEHDRFDQQLTGPGPRVGQLGELGAVRAARYEGDRAHGREYPGCLALPE